MKNVYVYVFDTQSDWEIGYLMPEIHTGNYIRKDRERPNIVTMGNTKDPVISLGGLRILPDISLDEFSMADAEALVLPGGLTWMEPLHRGILSLAQACLDAGILVAAICGATVALAGAGILNNNRYHTSNDLGYLQSVCPAYTGADYYVHKPVVTDGNLITATGVAPVEFTVHVLKKLDLFLPEVLDSWEKMYKTQDINYFLDIMQKIQ